MNKPDQHRIAAVSFLNAKPLIQGLGDRADVSLRTAPPADLPALLNANKTDVALVPVIDTIRSGSTWKIVSDACIACDGATLTVRIFSRIDPSDITTLHVDRDSHSSVALARLLWREKFGTDLELVTIDAAKARESDVANCEAVLLIGDKVVHPPPGIELFSTHIDLGATWKSLTGLPFVFAAWAAADDAKGKRIAPILSTARDTGVAMADALATEFAPKMNWPTDLAHRYLTQYLSFTIGHRQREGMRLFLELAQKHDIVDRNQELLFA